MELNITKFNVVSFGKWGPITILFVIFMNYQQGFNIDTDLKLKNYPAVSRFFPGMTFFSHISL